MNQCLSFMVVVQERDKELTRELRRQEKNDDLRKIFAKHANGFYAWLSEARYIYTTTYKWNMASPS